MDAKPHLVVFCDPEPLAVGAAWRDRALYRGLRLLQPGFRHVFALVPTRLAHTYIIVNSTAERLDLADVVWVPPVWADGGEYEATLAWGGTGRVVEAWPSSPGRWVPRGPLSCVAVVKHLLGIEAAHVVTPWQLYRHLGGDGDVGDRA